MNIKRTIIALAAASTVLAGSIVTASADEYTTREVKQEYAVQRQEKPFFQTFFNLEQAPATTKTAAPKAQANNAIGSLIAPADPHWGPAFDPDVE